MSDVAGWDLSGPQLCLLRAAVHPIRRHYTPSDRVYRDVTGAARRNGCKAARSGSAADLLRGLEVHLAAYWLVAG